MRRLVAFTSISADGRFTDAKGDISWTKRAVKDPEFEAFVADNAKGGGALLFGRITYELMTTYWPTPAAMERDPVVAGEMNRLPKVVFSRTLEKANWSNTKLVKGDPSTEVRRMKREDGEGMAILGSGTIVARLAQEGLIDEFQFVVIPVVLGNGRTVFDGIQKRLALKLTKTRAFANGNVLLCFEPMS